MCPATLTASLPAASATAITMDEVIDLYYSLRAPLGGRPRGPQLQRAVCHDGSGGLTRLPARGRQAHSVGGGQGAGHEVRLMRRKEHGKYHEA